MKIKSYFKIVLSMAAAVMLLASGYRYIDVKS